MSLLEPGEHPLWTGHPQSGLRLLQPVGAERVCLATTLVAVAAMWAFYPTIVSRETLEASDVAVVFALVTAIFALVLLWAAVVRQHVLSTLFYIVTNRRCIVCRRGRNWHLGDRLYVVSNVHSKTYPYEISPTRPYPSLRVGTLIDKNELQPFGFGLTHPGQPPSWVYRTTVPVAFEQIPDVQELLEIIQARTG